MSYRYIYMRHINDRDINRDTDIGDIATDINNIEIDGI